MKAQSTFARRVLPLVITIEEAVQRQKKLLIVDVQNPKYVTTIILGAQRLNEDILLKDIPKTQAILVTCLSGGRSFKVAQQLMQRGYLDVYVLKGGVMAWRQEGYMTELTKLPA